MNHATAPPSPAPVASPVWPTPVPAVPSHDDKLDSAPPRGTVTLYCQDTIILSAKVSLILA